MLFRMNAQDLLDGLNTVTKAIAARPARQILEGILIEAYDGGITLTGSDGNLTIETTFQAAVKENGNVVLPGKIFTELIRKLPGGEVTVKVSDNFMTRVQCQSSKFNLMGMNAADFPDMPEMHGGVSVQIPQNEFRSMISRVVFAVASDETRQILTGCLLEVRSDEARLVALDGYRLAMQKIRREFNVPAGKPVKAIVPGRVLNELGKILPDEETDCTVAIVKGLMQATFGNTKFSTTLLAGEYIDYQKILPSSFKTMVKADRISLENSIDRASLMAREGKNNLVRMRFEAEEAVISSKSELGDVEEHVPVTTNGESVDISFNSKYIMDVIRNISDAELSMQFNSSVSPCVVAPVEGDSYYYLVLPVRTY